MTPDSDPLHITVGVLGEYLLDGWGVALIDINKLTGVYIYTDPPSSSRRLLRTPPASLRGG